MSMTVSPAVRPIHYCQQHKTEAKYDTVNSSSTRHLYTVTHTDMQVPYHHNSLANKICYTLYLEKQWTKESALHLLHLLGILLRAHRGQHQSALTCEKSCVIQRRISNAVLGYFRVNACKASSCPSAVIDSATSGKIFVELILETFIKICR
jgi:hypothetical protein